MGVRAMAFVAYPVGDIARATAFYRDVVGLVPGETFGEAWIEFDVGALSFVLTKGESVGLAPGSQFSAAFDVDDIASFRERLIARGVPVTDAYEAPSCWSAFVTDPDGNRFAIHQRKAQLN